MEVTAIFENVDIAECALVRMRESGVGVLSHKTRPVKLSGKDSEGTAAMPPAAAFINVVPPAYGPMNFSAGMNDMWMPASLISWDNLPRPGATGGDSGGEVVLQVIVPDDKVAAVKKALTCNHGRRVRSIGG